MAKILLIDTTGEGRLAELSRALAARKERLSVAFCENRASLYPPGAERDLLLQLADVERRHEVKVSELFTNAAFPESW